MSTMLENPPSGIGSGEIIPTGSIQTKPVNVFLAGGSEEYSAVYRPTNDWKGERESKRCENYPPTFLPRDWSFSSWGNNAAKPPWAGTMTSEVNVDAPCDA